jgi:hypothetical protein
MRLRDCHHPERRPFVLLVYCVLSACSACATPGPPVEAPPPATATAALAPAAGEPGPRAGLAPGLGFFHPLKADGEDLAKLCAGVPPEKRERVHVFLVNGVDPLWLGNLNGLADYLRALGFKHTACGQMTHTPAYGQRIRTLRREDPGARVALLGFSAGANCVRELAWRLKEDQVPVDLLVYLGGDTIRNVPRSRPENVGRILNITGHGLVFYGYDLLFRGDQIDGARNLRLDARHFCLPSQREAIDALVRELLALADAAPVP